MKTKMMFIVTASLMLSFFGPVESQAASPTRNCYYTIKLKVDFSSSLYHKYVIKFRWVGYNVSGGTNKALHSKKNFEIKHGKSKTLKIYNAIKGCGEKHKWGFRYRLMAHSSATKSGKKIKYPWRNYSKNVRKNSAQGSVTSTFIIRSSSVVEYAGTK